MTTPATSFDVTLEQPIVNVEIEQYEVGTVIIQGAQGVRGDPGPGVDVWAETIMGDGTRTVFTLTHFTLSPMSVQVFRNGLCEVYGIGFLVSSDGNGTILTFTSPPLPDDEVAVVYHV